MTCDTCPKFTFHCPEDGQQPEVIVSLSTTVDLPTLLAAIDAFVRAAGYRPEGALEYVEPAPSVVPDDRILCTSSGVDGKLGVPFDP